MTEEELCLIADRHPIVSATKAFEDEAWLAAMEAPTDAMYERRIEAWRVIENRLQHQAYAELVLEARDD